MSSLGAEAKRVYCEAGYCSFVAFIHSKVMRVGNVTLATLPLKRLEIQQCSIKKAGLHGRWDKRLIYQACDVHSIIFLISYRCRALQTLYFHFCKIIKDNKITLNEFCKDFCKKLWKKKYLEHQTLSPWVICPSKSAPQHIILKIAGFQQSTMIISITKCLSK